MALTVTDLAIALRIIADSTETLDPSLESVLTRLRGTSNAIVAKYASEGTPASVLEQACIQIAAYLYDQPPSPRGTQFSTAWINSGASAVCEPWRVRRAGLLETMQ